MSFQLTIDNYGRTTVLDVSSTETVQSVKTRMGTLPHPFTLLLEKRRLTESKTLEQEGITCPTTVYVAMEIQANTFGGGSMFSTMLKPWSANGKPSTSFLGLF